MNELIFLFIILAGVLAVAGILMLAVLILSYWGHISIELPQKRAGRQGEQFASGIIREILRPDDVLLTNVNIAADGKNAELDNVIINKRGVFIIEVKNYSGDLFGTEEDYEWIKNKITPAGSFYQKTVQNPVRQVKRQVHILSRYLKQYGIDVWIEGYVFLVERNSPVDSAYILSTQGDIDRVIHHGTSNKLTTQKCEQIIELLSA